MKVCIFEDDKIDQLYPLTFLRPVFELRCGATKLWEKIARFYGKCETIYRMRGELVPVFGKRFAGANSAAEGPLNDDVLFINGRMLVLEGKAPPLSGDEEIGMKGDSIVFARLKKEKVSKAGPDICGFLASMKQAVPAKETDIPVISFPWDLVNNNPKAIEDDFMVSGGKSVKGEIHKLACVYGDENRIQVAAGAKVHPFVVLDTTRGPVILDEGSEILPFSRVEGPAYLGKNSQILGASRIREGTSIGPVCRVGGEVEETIIHAYSNKYHDGFLGHAYVCEWVNLGALTTNSDLKNDYSSVSVHIKNTTMDSGSTKVGSFIGDHTKTSIGTFLNTGTVIGIMCNVVGSGGVAPKYIPSFCWFLNNSFSKGYGFRMQTETARAAMSRRGVSLTEEDIALLKYVHELTKDDREEAVRKSRML